MMTKSALTSNQEKIIREQIQKNSKVIDWIIFKIDLLMNKEGHGKDSKVVLALQEKLDILMEENDTFRKVFWKHVQGLDMSWCDGTQDAVRYLLVKVNQRHAGGGLSGGYEVGTASAVTMLK